MRHAPAIPEGVRPLRQPVRRAAAAARGHLHRLRRLPPRLRQAVPQGSDAAEAPHGPAGQRQRGRPGEDGGSVSAHF